MLETWSNEIVETAERILKNYPHLPKSDRHEVERSLRKYRKTT
jgi:hypothetical protein